MKKNILVCLLFISLTCLYSEKSELYYRTQRWFEVNPTSQPIWMTPDEIDRADEIGRDFQETQPPVGPVRAVAEFEQMDAVMIRYPLGIPVEFVALLSEEIEVITLVTGYQQNSCNNAFLSAGVNMSNITYLNTSTDSYWARDYGPWFILDGNDELGVVDFVYNRPRYQDDEVAITFANTYGLNLYGMDLVQTGGNYMCDGLGGAAQSDLVYEENGNNQQNVNTLMEQYLGITNYHVVDDPNNTYIDHIDCWGKFLAPDKVLIRSVPQYHAQYDEIEAVANYFSNQDCAWGYPYEVYRVNTPGNQPYTNSLILNNRVFVPITGSSDDNAALQVYQNAMPGYEINGVINTTSNYWESTDALHCRTHELADEDMLYVEHIPYHGELPLEPITFEAYIYPYSGAALYADSLYVEIVNDEFPARMLLSLTQSGNNIYTSELFNPVPGTTYSYCIHAADESGRAVNQPIMGMLDPHEFSITEDNISPIINHTAIESTNDTALPLEIVADVTDNYMVNTVYMEYEIDGITETLTLNDQGDNTYLAEFNHEHTGTFTVSYRIVAEDGTNTSYYPEDRWYNFTVTSTGTNEEIQVVAINSFDSIYPSPTSMNNSSVTIKYSSTSEPVFKVYNLKGQKIRTLRGGYGKNQSSLKWDLSDDRNKRVSSGLYFIRMENSSYKAIRKLLIVE